MSVRRPARLILGCLLALTWLPKIKSSLVFQDEIFPTTGIFPSMRFADKIKATDDLLAVFSLSKVGPPDRNTSEGRITIYHTFSSNDSSGWVEMATMTAADKFQGLNFASSFEFFSSDQTKYLLVGSGGQDKKSDGIVYIYTYMNQWNLTQRVKHPTVFFDKTGFQVTFKNFGSAMAIYGNTILIASLNEAVFFYTTNSSDAS